MSLDTTVVQDPGRSAARKLLDDAVGEPVWLADLTHTGRGPASDTVPLGIGFLAAYAQDVLTFEEPIRLFKYPAALSEALSSCRRPPRVVGFTNYSWNSLLSRRYAAQIKRVWPDTTVVFGGPNFPLGEESKEAYLRQCPEIDFFVDREGERAFALLVAMLAEAGWDRHLVRGEAPAAYSIDRDGAMIAGPTIGRLRELDEIPSPYLQGLMDEFLDGYLVPTLQSNRGCPFKCAFCLEGDSYFTKVNFFSPERIIAELHYIGSRMRDVIDNAGRNELMITDSNFAMFMQDADICSAIGECKDLYGWPLRVNVTTGKNKRDRVLSSIEKAQGTIQLSGAVQSLDPGVLENVNRANIKTDDLIAVAQDAAEHATKTYSDVILGLPGDSVAAHVDSVSTLVDAGFSRVNTFQFALLMGAQINTAAQRETFRLETAYRPIPRGFGRYEIFGDEHICGEIDEICVGSNTMSFEDYVSSRIFDLTVFLFHNDGMFGVTEAALKLAGVPVGEWLTRLWMMSWPDRLEVIRRDFTSQTRAQLFASPEDVQNDLEDHIDDYLAGTRGNNLLYSSRARALEEAVPELGETARTVAAASGPEALSDFVAEAAEFDAMSLSGVVSEDNLAEEVGRWFHYDFCRLGDGDVESITAVQLDGPRYVRFMPSPRVDALVRTYRRTMGATPDGLGRALSRVRVEDFRRQPLYA